MEIGNWVRRQRTSRNPHSRWHLVESIIEDAAITHCGRRLESHADGGLPLEVSEVMPLTRMIGQPQLCHRCQ